MDTKDLIIYQKTLPQREAVYTDFPEQLNTEIKEYLCSQNISQLYCHQAQMFEEAMKRQNIVITDNELDCFDCAATARSLEEAVQLCEPGKEIFIIGGGSVYRQFIPMADRLMVTHIDAEFEADTFFPEINPDEWYISEQEDYLSDEPGELSFSYTTYLRRR